MSNFIDFSDLTAFINSVKHLHERQFGHKLRTVIYSNVFYLACEDRLEDNYYSAPEMLGNSQFVFSVTFDAITIIKSRYPDDVITTLANAHLPSTSLHLLGY